MNILWAVMFVYMACVIVVPTICLAVSTRAECVQRARHQRSACRWRVHHPELYERRHVRHAGHDRREGVRHHPREGHRPGDQVLLPPPHRQQTPQDHGRRRVGWHALASRAGQALSARSFHCQPISCARLSTCLVLLPPRPPSCLHCNSSNATTTGAFSI